MRGFICIKTKMYEDIIKLIFTFDYLIPHSLSLFFIFYIIFFLFLPMNSTLCAHDVSSEDIRAHCQVVFTCIYIIQTYTDRNTRENLYIMILKIFFFFFFFSTMTHTGLWIIFSLNYMMLSRIIYKHCQHNSYTFFINFFNCHLKIIITYSTWGKFFALQMIKKNSLLLLQSNFLILILLITKS